MPKIVNPDEKRNMIAQAACRAIAAKGIANVTMTDIAAEANVTTGMIVNYFDTKDEIITAALRLAFVNIRRKIAQRTSQDDLSELCDILEPAIAIAQSDRQDIAVWIGFWGMLSADPEMQNLNDKLHQEGLATYAAAIRVAWPESAGWPETVFADVLVSVATCLFGLSAGAITNPGTWTPQMLRKQLRLQLQLIRAWAISEASDQA